MVTMVTNNQFNAYCIDCYQRQSTHANITHGTFICEPCAQVHLMYFGMHKHYIKEIFTELWDPHQLNVVQRFGNKAFYDHLQKIGLQSTQTDLVHKYTHPGVKKYKKQVIATVMGKKVKNSSSTPSQQSLPKNSSSSTSKTVKKVDKKVEKFDKKVDKFFDKVAKIFD